MGASASMEGIPQAEYFQQELLRLVSERGLKLTPAAEVHILESIVAAVPPSDAEFVREVDARAFREGGPAQSSLRHLAEGNGKVAEEFGTGIVDVEVVDLAWRLSCPIFPWC